MKKIKTNPSQLWDQWLQRLHGIEDPQKKYFRLELLELLIKCETGNRKTFLHRLGTVMSRSLHNGIVIVADKKNQKILFTSDKRAGNKTIKNLPKTDKELSIKSFSRGKKLIDHKAPTKGIYQLPITIFQDDDIVLAILSDDSLSTDDKQFLHFVAGLIKVFEQKTNTSRELAQEQRLLGLLTQHINEGLALFSQDLKVSLWNRPLQRITGYSPKESHDKLYSDLIRIKGQSNWLMKLIKKYNSNKQQSSFSIEGEVISKSKSSKWVSISGSFLRDEGGNIEQTIVLIRDISKLKESEERKNEFISIATHELRTPITAIKGYLSLLSNQQDDFTDKQKNYLENATIATERLVALTEDLLQVTRIDEDRLRFNLKPIELTRIIKKVSDDFSEKARDKGLKFNLFLPPYKTTIVGDQIRLEQIFSNLIDNAIKYSLKGSVSISFEHYTEKATKEDKVAVIIKDTGVGIESKDMEGIFDKFHRSESVASLRETGVGLGLYIVKSFIEKQNGSITVKSRPKRGSTFAVTFPVISDPLKKVEESPSGVIVEKRIGSSIKGVNR